MNRKYVIVFHVLDGFHGQWSVQKVLGQFDTLETAEEKLREWGYIEQKGYQLGDFKGRWLVVRIHHDDVPENQPQYCIIMAEVVELKPY